MPDGDGASGGRGGEDEQEPGTKRQRSNVGLVSGRKEWDE